MTIDARQLECFIAVAEERNLTRAAARLMMSQPPLTRRIKRLEGDVGATLLRRTAGGVELTEPGHTLLERAYRIVALSRHAVEQTKLSNVGRVGHLNVGYYDSAILGSIPALLAGFTAANPGVMVTIQQVFKPMQLDYLRDALLHVGFGRHYGVEADLTCRRVATERLYVALGPAAGLRDCAMLSVDELRGRPLAVYPCGHPGFADEVVDLCLRAGFAPTVAVEAEDVIACLAYVAIGSAIAVVPESATRTRPCNVYFVPLADGVGTGLDCVYLSGRRSPVVDLFAAFLDARDAAPLPARLNA